MKNYQIFTIFLLILIIISACEKSNNPIDTIVPTPSTEQYQKNVLSYDQYINLVTSIRDELRFSSVKMELTESSLDNPMVIIVNETMSFGKKKYLSLNNDLKDPTQHYLTYRDTEKGFNLIMGWIYTNVNQGENLLYFKPNIVGNTGDFSSILSYKNILIHLQLTHTTPSNISDEEFVKENEAVLQDLVFFLEEANSL